jgi:hypothetical protein
MKAFSFFSTNATVSISLMRHNTPCGLRHDLRIVAVVVEDAASKPWD